MGYNVQIMNIRAFIIAEAGVNHDGDLKKALALAAAAKAAGADAVKFQTFKAERLVSRAAPKAAYQVGTTHDASQFDMIRRLELDEAAHHAIAAECVKLGITFLSTPFDEGSADLLERLDVPLFKVPSGEITNKPLIEHVARKKRPVILSTGMSTIEDVRDAVGWVRAVSSAPLTLLHCLTEYPAPADQVNLAAMATLRREFSLPVGYSDHTLGIEVSVAAAALGAEVLEKHLTLDSKAPGPDHAASLEPTAFTELVRCVRSVQSAIGDGVKRVAPCEQGNRDVARRSVVAARALPGGHVLSREDISFKRPGHGIAPAEAERVIGRSLRAPIGADEVLTWEVLA
jgi:N,N'-diacetyllegionaminate synthase